MCRSPSYQSSFVKLNTLAIASIEHTGGEQYLANLQIRLMLPDIMQYNHCDHWYNNGNTE